jgi:sugar/nucleoside kinase (ribokinase family)
VDLELVIIGQLSKDILVIDGQPREPALGGSVYYAAFAARPAGVRVLVIPKLALRDWELLSEFWAQGLAVLPIYCSRTTVMEDIFEKERGYARWSRILELAAPFSSEEIPVREAEIFYLAALIYGEIPEPLMAELAEREAVITDQGGVTVSDGARVLFRPFPPYAVEARSGRGDTCFAAYLSWRLRHDLPDSVEHAARITARKLERPGPYRD